ncbi:hypothetical protein HPP92_003232 [Vanilla planifolia]|uniref:Uncharacterized protein n=1 Tax=Vanilla planifolia TaxID=51239 RepID=A0A835S1V8_VANPL|nr:hypothetical protein HPP92_003232 [Vanilla planifolia]
MGVHKSTAFREVPDNLMDERSYVCCGSSPSWIWYLDDYQDFQIVTFTRCQRDANQLKKASKATERNGVRDQERISCSWNWRRLSVQGVEASELNQFMWRKEAPQRLRSSPLANEISAEIYKFTEKESSGSGFICSEYWLAHQDSGSPYQKGMAATSILGREQNPRCKGLIAPGMKSNGLLALELQCSTWVQQVVGENYKENDRAQGSLRHTSQTSDLRVAVDDCLANFDGPSD